MKFPFLKYALKNLVSKPSTVMYPAVPVDPKPNYRGWVAYDPEKCVNCGMCMEVCSPSAITKTVEKVAGGENITYIFDMTSCTFCGTCADFCDSKAITMSENYHIVSEHREDLRTIGTRFKKATGKLVCKPENCIYCGLCAKKCVNNAITVDRATKTWTLDESKCGKCGNCVEACRKDALYFEEPAPEVVLFQEENCIYCGLCAKNCPVNAITVDRPSKTWEINRDICKLCGKCVEKCRKSGLSIGAPEK